MGKCKKGRMSVGPYFQARPKKGRFVSDFRDLTMSDNRFEKTFQVTPNEFDCLLSLLEPYLEAMEKTKPCDKISAAEKLAITLEFYAIKRLEYYLASTYRISDTCVANILNQVTEAIECLIKEKESGLQIEESCEEESGEEESCESDTAENVEHDDVKMNSLPESEAKDAADVDEEPSLTALERTIIDYIQN